MAQGSMEGVAINAPAALDGGQCTDLAPDRDAAARLWLHAQSLSGRPRPPLAAIWRDASFRPGHRCPVWRAHCRNRGEFPSAPHRGLEIRPQPHRPYFPGSDYGSVFVGLFHPTDSSFRFNWPVVVTSGRYLDNDTGVRKNRARLSHWRAARPVAFSAADGGGCAIRKFRIIGRDAGPHLSRVAE